MRPTNKLYDSNTDKVDLNHFPDVLAEFCRQGSKSIGCPESYLPTLVLTLGSICIGNSASVRVKSDWKEQCSLYSVIIGSPGMRKTPCIKLAFSALSEIQKENKRKYNQLLKEYNLLGSDEKKEENKPVKVLAYVTDTTIEALTVALVNNPLSVLILNDEIAHFFNSFNMYKSGGNDRQAILSLYNNTQIIVNRKGSPVSQVDDPFASIIGGIQLDPLRKLFSGDNDGLLDRVIYSFPDQTVSHKYSDYEVEQSVQLAYADLIKRVYRESEAYVKSQGHDEYRLTDDAKALWIQWQEELPVNSRLSSYREKSIARCIRMSLILEVFQNPERRVLKISEETMRGAIHLSNFFFHDYIKMLDFLEDENLSQKLSLAVEWLQERYREGREIKKLGNVSGITLRKFQQSEVAGLKKRDEILELWEVLVDRGYGTINPKDPKPGTTAVFSLSQEFMP